MTRVARGVSLRFASPCCSKAYRLQAWKPWRLAVAFLAGFMLWALPTGASAGIQVTEATWGKGATPVFTPNGCSHGEVVLDGNLTSNVAAKCNGLLTCTYNAVSDTDLNGNGIKGEFPADDPAFGCSKQFVVKYTCPPDSTVKTETTSGITVTLSCPPPPDSDGDGVNDTSDSCPGTAAGSPVNASGCSGAQLVALACPAGGSYKNHGAYVSCVSKAAESALAAGLLTSAEKDAIVSAAAQSSIGK